MDSYIDPPRPLPLLWRLLLGLVERRLGKRLVANRILAWYPKALLGSGILEALVAHDESEVPKRLLKLIRVYTSFRVSCPFCIDLNSLQYRDCGVTDEEILALQADSGAPDAPSFSEAERAALAYADCMCRSPVRFESETIDAVRRHFSERGVVIIASTCAQVNFWARLIQAFGVAPAGFSAECSLLNLDRYRTLTKPDPAPEAGPSPGHPAP
ncbi:MAG: hypothetical protein M0Z80_06840 [Treponema sp.]|nr:hypothetical protein [Treponema sp.]